MYVDEHNPTSDMNDLYFWNSSNTKKINYVFYAVNKTKLAFKLPCTESICNNFP